MLKERILDVAQPVLGTRYRYGGATPRGFDCSGFTRFVFGQFGLKLPHGSRSQVLLGTPVQRDELRPGDLVFFDIHRRGRVSHVGIYLGDSRMIHASIHKGVTIDSLHEPYYNRHYYAARRIPQLAVELLAMAGRNGPQQN
ncbi:MAG: C40 family peptidase [Oceanidesulfovibrio sp.]